MGLLAPLFLAALAAIAVPVLVHLTHRQRREPVAFPSLMFLRRVEFRTTKRQRIRHPLLFGLRVLAILLVVLAFARPFFRSGDAGAADVDGGREIVILLDHSFSMGYGDRWERARTAAHEAIATVGPDDRATIVRFASRAEALLEPTADRAALTAVVDAARPGTHTTRYAPALSLARGLIARAERPRRVVVLITDFQRGGWTAGEELRLPAGTTLEVVDVGDGPAPNIVVAAVEFERAIVADRERITTTARVANRGDAPVDGVPVTLTVDGREIGRRSIRLEPNAVATVRFEPFALPDVVGRGTVRAGSDALSGDNVRHFVLERGTAVDVLLVQDASASPARSLYLRRALALGADPRFRVTLRRSDALAAADLENADVVILDDVRPPRGEIGRRLRAFVRAGGGLVVTAGERTRPDDWTGDDAELLPARVGDLADRVADRGGRLGALDRNHPVLEPFSAPRSGNFSAARFFRYRPLTAAPDAAVVARFDDGSAALVERRAGRGRVLVWGSTLDNVWNDLPVQPVFLPFMHQLVKHAAGWEAERAWRTVGEVVDVATLTTAGENATADYVARAPTGATVRLDGRAALELTEPGVWEVRRFGERNAPVRLIAANIDLAESDLSRVVPAEIVAAVAPSDSATAAAAATPLTAAEREARQSWWWFLLLVAALLLAAETMLSNRLSRRAAGARVLTAS